MSASARLLAARAARDEARDALDRRLVEIQEDLEARGIGSRIADRVSEGARETFDHALEVADENPGVIAGTIAALGFWILRNPIIRRLEQLLSGGQADEEHDDADQKRIREQARTEG